MIRLPDMRATPPLGLSDPDTNSYIRVTKGECTAAGGGDQGPTHRNTHFECVINGCEVGTGALVPLARFNIKALVLTGELDIVLEDRPMVSPGGDGTFSQQDVEDTIQELVRRMFANGLGMAAICEPQ